jgi:hypothetical protein
MMWHIVAVASRNLQESNATSLPGGHRLRMAPARPTTRTPRHWQEITREPKTENVGFLGCDCPQIRRRYTFSRMFKTYRFSRICKTYMDFGELFKNQDITQY